MKNPTFTPKELDLIALAVSNEKRALRDLGDNERADEMQEIQDKINQAFE